MASFNSHSFYETGSQGRNIPRWNKKRNVVTKIIPGGTPVVQDIGAEPQQLVMPVQGTESQLNALAGDVDGSTHSLSWSGGTDTCLLVEMAPIVEVVPGKTIFQSVLTFLK